VLADVGERLVSAEHDDDLPVRIARNGIASFSSVDGRNLTWIGLVRRGEATGLMTVSKQTCRWLAHVGLNTTTVTSLAFEFVFTVPILLGSLFVASVLVHFGQRRRTTI
jgi:hypothetical protein